MLEGDARHGGDEFVGGQGRVEREAMLEGKLRMAMVRLEGFERSDGVLRNQLQQVCMCLCVSE